MPETRLPELHYPYLWQCFAALTTAVIVVLSLIPSPPQPPGPLAWDKGQHALAYAALAAVWGQATAGRHWGRVVAGLVVLGIGVELLQGRGSTRHAELADVVANVAGIGIGVALSLSPLGRCLAGLDGGLARLTGRRR